MVVWEALDALSHQLELCKIDDSSRVVVLLDDEPSNSWAALLRAAISRSGSNAIEIRPVGSHRFDDSVLVAALATADVVVTTTNALALPSIDAALNARSAQVLVIDTSTDPQHYPPHANLRRRVRSLHDHVINGETLIVSDSNGTALRVDLARASITSDHGLFEADSDWVDFPSGWVNITPTANSVGGDVVLMPGDGNLAARRLISSPVRLELVDDHVSTIHGDSADADVIRALFEHAGETSAYGVASLSIGLNPGRKPLGPFDDRVLNPRLSRLTAGMITLGFGDNLVADRPCQQTMHLTMAGRNLTIDALPVVVNGSLDGDFGPDVYEL